MLKQILTIGMLGILAMSTAQGSERQTVFLEKKNTIALREEFTQSSIDALKQKLIELSHSLPAKEHIYLYLNTPGGSVIAGSNLLTVMQGIKNPVDVVVQFAASMGYMTTQGTTGKRYVTQDGILMAHRAYLGVEGQTPGEISTRLAFFEGLTNELADMAAKRTGISTKDYQDKVRAEYWVSGQAAVKDKQADEVVNVACSKDLDGTYGETLYTMFGPVEIEWASCPLITGPVAINFPRNEAFSEVENQAFRQTIMNMLIKSPVELVNDHDLQNNYHRYVK